MNSIEEIMSKDFNELVESIIKLKIRAEIAKKKILSDEFSPLVNNGDKEELIRYVVQFIPLLHDVVLFPDDKLNKKLREYGFRNPVLKWFTPVEDIIQELEQLRKLEGVFFVLNSYLFGCVSYIQIKVLVEAIESFGLDVKHGKNEESNILHKNYDNLFRRRDYNLEKAQKGKMNLGESSFYDLVNYAEKHLGDESNVKTMLLDASRGEFKMTKEFLSAFLAHDISKNKVYSALFPLLKLTCKDREMLSSEEFDNLEEVIYGGSYNRYKVSRVKKILSIK